MTLLLIFLSITSMVMSNCVSNAVSKKHFTSPGDIHRFNTIVYIVCIVLFGVAALDGNFSLFTIIVGLLFGIATCLCKFYQMLSLSHGPMHITLLITTSSMIIPTMSGIFFGEAFIPSKLIAVAFLIFFIYLSLDKTSDTKFSKKWFIYCAIAFIFQGGIGVLQKIHQHSPYRAESNGLLIVAFIISLIYTRIMAKEKVREFHISKKQIWFAIIVGVCSYVMNYINLKLSGILPSQLFFPVINGSSIVLSSIFSVVLFKEKLSKIQLLGLCGGILSLIAICILN